MRIIIPVILTLLVLACGQDDPITPKPPIDSITVLKTYGGTDTDEGSSITATTDGGYAIVGSFESNDRDFEGLNKGESDILVMKFDSEGNREWIQIYGGSGFDFAFSIIQTLDNGFVITGGTASDDGGFNVLNKGGKDIFVLKLDKNGEKQWLETFGGSSSESGLSIVQTSDGGYAITGYFRSNDEDFDGLYSYDGNSLNVFILKIRGNQQWLKTFGGDNNEISYSIVETNDGSYAITGFTSSQNGDFDQCELRCLEDIFVIKVDSDGSHQWTKRIGGSLADIGRSMVATTEGVIVTGMSGSNDGDFNGLKKGFEDVFALKIDSDGNLNWINTYGGSDSEEGYSIVESIDSGYILTGSSVSNDGDFTELNSGSSDIYAIKIDFDGNIEWVETFGGTRGESGNSITQSTNGEYVFTGYFESNDGLFEDLHSNADESADAEDIFIIKLETDDEIH